MELERFYGEGDRVGLYGLSLVMLLAGLSKFFYTSLWLGFEPAWLQSLLPLTGTQFIYVTGAAETFMGLALASGRRTRLLASLIGLWLLAITLTVASMGLYTLAIRDLGLTALAYYVASRNG